VLSSSSLARQVEIDIATWLDRDLNSVTTEATRKADFGREVWECQCRMKTPHLWRLKIPHPDATAA